MKMKVVITAGILIQFFLFSLAPAADESKYIIGPGDVLEISVWKDESLSRTVVVPPDGIISFTLIGDIDTSGMTVTDIRNIVTEKIKEYVPEAFVSVILMEINSLNAYVIGKVNKPGTYSILLDTNVMQILSMAGGVNPFASESNIQVLRRVNNVTVKIPFDYKEVLKGENLKQNIVLQRGDVVVVP